MTNAVPIIELPGVSNGKRRKPAGVVDLVAEDGAAIATTVAQRVIIDGLAALTTKGDLLGYSTVPLRIPIGTNTHVATANSALAAGWGWAAIGGSGALKQVVKVSSVQVITSSAIVPFDNTAPLISEGAQALSLSITPQSASSRLIFICSGYQDGAALSYGTSLHKGSTSLASVAGGQARVMTLHHTLIAGSTSLQTYTIRFGSSINGFPIYFNANSGGTRLYGGVASTHFTIWEVDP